MKQDEHFWYFMLIMQHENDTEKYLCSLLTLSWAVLISFGEKMPLQVSSLTKKIATFDLTKTLWIPYCKWKWTL